MAWHGLPGTGLAPETQIFLASAGAVGLFAAAMLPASTWARWVTMAALVTGGLGGLLIEFLSVRELGVDSYNAVFQTTLAEAREFVLSRIELRPAFAPVWLAVSLPGLWLAWRACSTPRDRWRRIALMVTAALCVLTLVPAVAVLPVLWERQAVNFQRAAEQFAEERARFATANAAFRHSGAVQVVRDVQPDLFVYIGESISRHHVSSYGYPRDTGAALRRWQTDLIQFDDVVAPHSHTAESLSEVLSNANFPDSVVAGDDVSLIALLQRGGYHVTWLSNQNEFGLWDNPVSRHAKLADVHRFYRRSVGLTASTDVFDEKLTEALTETPAPDEPQATFLHGYAGHHDYCQHIPPAERQAWRDELASLSKQALFGAAKGSKAALDCYDSAVAYSLKNFAALLEHVSKRARPAVAIYFSDHGENVLDGSGHESSLHSYRHLEVPLLMYFNASARTQLPEMVSAAQANRQRALELSDFFDTALQLAGIESPDSRAQASWLAAHGGETKPRWVLPREGTFVAVDADTPLPDRRNVADYLWRARYAMNAIQPADARKVCAHRVNTVFRFLESVRVFDCVEVDLWIEGDEVWVVHPPARNPRLPASTLLGMRPRDKRVWLDVKNLNADTLPAFVRWLERQPELLTKGDVLVETDFVPGSAADVESVRQLASRVPLSYYLPTDPAVACALDQRTAADCEVLGQTIRRTLSGGGFTHLTFDSRAWPFVRQHNFGATVRLGTWEIRDRNFERVPAGVLFESVDWYISSFDSPYYH